MAKLISITPETEEQCKAEFDKKIDEIRKNFVDIMLKSFSSGKIDFSFGSFKKSFDLDDKKANLHFSECAWLKVQTLVREFSNEVAWNGTAYRDEETDDYYIDDIFVHPQEVTGATVNTDQAKYEEWLYKLDDETFNHLRMQGHSHVNMDVTPSSTDEMHQSKILSQLKPTDFYIFLIFNKRGNKFIRIYDKKKNVMYETGDITVYVGEDKFGLETFLENAKKLVVTKTYSYGLTKKEYEATKPCSGATSEQKTKKQKKYSQYYDYNYGYDSDDYYGYDYEDYSDPFYSNDGYNRGGKKK